MSKFPLILCSVYKCKDHFYVCSIINQKTEKVHARKSTLVVLFLGHKSANLWTENYPNAEFIDRKNREPEIFFDFAENRNLERQPFYKALYAITR